MWFPRVLNTNLTRRKSDEVGCGVAVCPLDVVGVECLVGVPDEVDGP